MSLRDEWEEKQRERWPPLAKAEVARLKQAAAENWDVAQTYIDKSERLRRELAEIRDDVRRAVQMLTSEDPGRVWHAMGILRRIAGE